MNQKSPECPDRCFSAQIHCVQIRAGKTTPGAEAVAIEAPLQILLNGSPYSITMRTPGHDLDLARGLMISEGRCESGAQIEAKQQSPNVVDLRIDPASLIRVSDRGRNLASYSSCGLCGQVQLTDFALRGASLESRHFEISVAGCEQFFSTMKSGQEIFAATGGVHAAAAFQRNGNHLVTREDLGRHNAVDKVIGHLAATGGLGFADILTVSSRASYEIVAKAYRAQIPFIAVISAVSSLAVTMAQEKGITLVGFCRDQRLTAYAHPQRVIP